MHDASLMELSLQFWFDVCQLQEINSCRVYLQVITVSDVTDASGLCLLPSAMNGHRDSTCPSHLLWPVWQRPTTWTSWRRLLNHISTRGRLLQELGEWVASPHQQWQWYHDTSQDVVYHHAIDQWS